MKSRMVLLSTVVLLLSCASSPTDLQELQEENERLRAESHQLRAELEALKLGPNQLLARAFTHYKSGEYIASKDTLNIIVNVFPTSPEAERAKRYITRVDDAIANQERIDRQKRMHEALTQHMEKRFDEMEEVTWYTDRSTPERATGFYLYFGKKEDGDPWLRMRARYCADSWLFVESFLVVADGKQFEGTAADFDRNLSNGKFLEWYDERVGPREYEMVKAVVDSEKATVRFRGRLYYVDHLITQTEKGSLQRVLDAYQKLGGSIPSG